jgi:hypothetical protein
MSAVPVRGQATGGQAVSVFEATLPQNEGEPVFYRDLISGFVQVDLRAAGLKILDTEAPSAPLTGVEKFLDLAAVMGADLLAVSRFSIREEQIRIDFSWYDVAARAPLAATSGSQAVDLSFDRIIHEGIARLLRTVEPWLAELSARRPALAGEPANLPEPVSAGPSARGRSLNACRWEVGAGSAPFLTVGRASDYFKLGFLPSLSGSFRLGRPGAPWKIGFFGATCWFRASGSGTEGSAVLAPLGPELRYASSGERPLGLFLRLSGGPALFTLTPEYQESKTKVIPYLLAGMGLRLPLGARLALTLEPVYLVFFEPQAPIMGFTPSGNVYVCW